MKPFLPTSLLLVGMFVAGCNTPENTFMAGGEPVAAKPAAPVAKVVPAKPAAPAPVVVPPKPKPVVVKPVVTVTNPPPVVAPVKTTPATTKPAEVPKAPAAPLPTIVTPDASIAGRVVVYNAAGRFVVLSFPPGAMPKQDQSIFLYRGGLKVGEIKITGPQRDSSIVGDVVNGDAQVGDEARDR